MPHTRGRRRHHPAGGTAQSWHAPTPAQRVSHSAPRPVRSGAGATAARCTCRFWLDNLYLRAVYHNAPNDREYQYISLIGLPPLRWPLEGEGKRYITRTTFQGDGLGPTVGVWSDENVHIESTPPPSMKSLPHPHSSTLSRPLTQ